jgi:hypothetical protein
MTLRIENKVAIQPGVAANEAVTKGQLDTAQSDASNRANHYGTQTVDTLSDFTAAVNSMIQAVVDAAPEALDTLNELAAALGDDPNFAATIAGQLSALSDRVTYVEGDKRSFSALVGNGAASSFSVIHAWDLANKNRVACEIVEVSSGETVLASVTRVDKDTVTVDFGSSVPNANQYLVLLSEITG